MKRRVTKVLCIILVLFPFTGKTQEYLRVYTSAPGMMVSNVTGGTIITEDFTSFAGVPNFSWAPSPAGFSSIVGNYIQTAGVSYVKNDDQYGSGTGKYMSIRNGGKVKLSFTQPQRYFGFAWPAGDGQNTIKILRNGQVIGTFATSNVVALLPKNANNFITSINNTSYSTYDYYGKPGAGQNANEPYAYLHFHSSPGLSFDEIEFSMGAGGEFENDNHSIVTNGDAILQGDWVELISIFTPSATDDSGVGMPGDPVTIDVLDNDSEGSSPINPATVQIEGTAGPAVSLVVPGEGTWSVNPANGFITFTPLISFTGSPTPIQYSVKDNQGYASNMATVTITYPVGPTAADDAVSTAINTIVVIDVLGNDLDGSTSIDPATVTLTGTQPNPATEGTFTVNAITGEITFTPVNGFTGTAIGEYQVCDQNGLCDVAEITISVFVGATNLYPATGPGTLAFEDLWPGKGDYDFNDLVVDYQFEINSNPGNFVEQLTATFTVRAFGAELENGFGFQLAEAINPADLTVSGFNHSESYVTIDPNGTEANQSKPTIIVFENAFALMPHPGIGIGVNTTQDAPYVTPVTLTIEIQFKPNTYSYNDLDIANFNPFLIVNKVRGHEVHLPNYPPTDLADVTLFGMWEDDSDPLTGKYYLTENNLPWAISIYEQFDYPREKQDITWVHLKFAEWARSGGVLFPDWYKNLQGYRNESGIYNTPSAN